MHPQSLPPIDHFAPMQAGCVVVFSSLNADHLWVRWETDNHQTTLHLCHAPETLASLIPTVYGGNSDIVLASLEGEWLIARPSRTIRDMLYDEPPATLRRLILNPEVVAMPENSAWLGIRALMAEGEAFTTAHLQSIAALKAQAYWQHRYRYCPHCGTALPVAAPDAGKVCPQCTANHYPAMHCAILCVVIRQQEILLVHTHSMKAGYFTAIAGFVNAGESLEACVLREVQEETNLQVGNLRYVGSQTWCYPNHAPAQMMVAFVADYCAGVFLGANEEISEIRWWSGEFNESIALPPPATLSRQVIDHALVLAKRQ